MLAATRNFAARSRFPTKTSLLPSVSVPSSNSLLNQSKSFHSLTKPKLRGYPPVSTLPPLPPPEWEADGSPRRYPLSITINEHGYTWEHWHIRDCGIYHTVYHAELAVDMTPHGAWMCSVPVWVGCPILLAFTFLAIVSLKNAGNIGIKPKRYTIDWVMAMKERERCENSNPITRYLDRRVAERGHHLYVGDYLPYGYYFPWMHHSFDHEWREERGMADLREGGKWSYKRVDEGAGGDEEE